jgi:hypothetical protein
MKQQQGSERETVQQRELLQMHKLHGDTVHWHIGLYVMEDRTAVKPLLFTPKKSTRA